MKGKMFPDEKTAHLAIPLADLEEHSRDSRSSGCSRTPSKRPELQSSQLKPDTAAFPMAPVKCTVTLQMGLITLNIENPVCKVTLKSGATMLCLVRL